MKKSDRRWKEIKFEELGANIANVDFEGLAGFEECNDYTIVSSKNDRRNRKRKSDLKTKSAAKNIRKSASDEFLVEDLVSDTNSVGAKNLQKIKSGNANENDSTVTALKTSKSESKKKNKKVKKKKMKKTGNQLIENVECVKSCENSNVNLENMYAWSNFGISESIVKALADQEFYKPTLIQELTLPPAMHGRRDILGAAETGSGKTLAFGIPIINGILYLKEKHLKDGIIPSDKISKDLYSFEDDENKIININKLSKEDASKLLKRYRKTKKVKGQHKIVQNNKSDDSSESAYDDSDESESASDEDSETAKNDEKECSGPPNESLSELEDYDDGDLSDISNQTDSDDMKNSISDNNDIGCVKVIDDIPSVNFNQSSSSAKTLKPLYALILTPTRELAIQVKNHLVAAAKHSDIRVAVVVGGMAQVKQERILSKSPEIVVATPGRLWEMIQQGNDHLSQIKDISYLAIDETDRMIEHGHFEELHLILDKINDDEKRRKQRQNFVFSATLTMVHDLPLHLKVKKFTKKGKVLHRKYEKMTSEQKLKKVIELLGITDPKVIDVTEKNRGSSNTLTECRISCTIDEKDYYLYYVLQRHPGRTIVFCNSIGCVKRLSQLFNILQCKPLPLHASMQQRQRLKNLDRFRDNPEGLLIATDVAARGLDIPNVEHVIHYQVPRTAENYVHRSGRTARANKEGITILIMESGEIQNYVKLCRTLSKCEDLPHFPITDALLVATKQRVNLAREIDQLELRMRKVNSEIGWYEKSMREMDIVLDEREIPGKMDKSTEADQKSLLNNKKKQLTHLLGTPLFPKGFSFKYPTNNTSMLEYAFGKKQNAIEAMKSALQIKQKKTIENKGKIGKNKWKKIKRKPSAKI